MNRRSQIRKKRIIKSIKNSLIFLLIVMGFIIFIIMISTLNKKNTGCVTVIDVGHEFNNYWLVIKDKDSYIRKEISIFEYQLYRNKTGKTVCLD